MDVPFSQLPPRVQSGYRLIVQLLMAKAAAERRKDNEGGTTHDAGSAEGVSGV